LPTCSFHQTGDQASRKIREETNFSRLIIGLTGNALDDDVTRFIAAGVDCVISKPLRSKQLQAIIRFTETEGLHSRKPAILVTERISGPEEDYHVVEVSSHLK
jgi:CheY-like chemotaxis protein